MKPAGPYCPTCHRRLHKLTAPPVQPCLACGLPVEGLGLGRPRQLHPECKRMRVALLARKRRAAKEVRP